MHTQEQQIANDRRRFFVALANMGWLALLTHDELCVVMLYVNASDASRTSAPSMASMAEAIGIPFNAGEVKKTRDSLVALGLLTKAPQQRPGAPIAYVYQFPTGEASR